MSENTLRLISSLSRRPLRVLFLLTVLSHDRRQILHFSVTELPTAACTTRQLLEACGIDEVPRYIRRDHDAVYGADFRQQAAALDIEDIITAPQSPWQNPYAERVINAIRRECLENLIVLGEPHLKSVIASHAECYHSARAHLSLNKNTPHGPPIQSPEQGNIFELKRIGGLYQDYVRMAA